MRVGRVSPAKGAFPGGEVSGGKQAGEGGKQSGWTQGRAVRKPRPSATRWGYPGPCPYGGTRPRVANGPLPSSSWLPLFSASVRPRAPCPRAQAPEVVSGWGAGPSKPLRPPCSAAPRAPTSSRGPDAIPGVSGALDPGSRVAETEGSRSSSGVVAAAARLSFSDACLFRSGSVWHSADVGSGCRLLSDCVSSWVPSKGS